MDLRLLTAISTAKAVKAIIRTLNGGATAAPGLLAEYIDPQALKKLAKKYTATILVTGTNGKTTTSRFLGYILQSAHISFIHNRSGSNLLRGLIGTLIEDSSLNGKSKVALLEVDEATIPEALSQTWPKVVVFNNLFRDQLDRYGEVDKIRKIWQKSLLQIPKETILVLNSDDHSVAHLAAKSKSKALYFGIEDPTLSIGKLPHASDFTSCINCDGVLKFDEVYLAHLGKYKCTSCGLVRPKPDVAAEKIHLEADKGFVASIRTPQGYLDLKIGLPGLYNVYNALSAITAAIALGIPLKTIKEALEGAKAAFGRTELVQIGEKKLFIGLVKNPAGFNELLRTLFQDKERRNVLICINDRIADGRDVSWLWDVDFEVLAGKIRKIWVAGIRAYDMGLRLKYTGLNLGEKIEPNLSKALEEALDRTPEGYTLYILPTYTSMLELKHILADKGVSGRFWED